MIKFDIWQKEQAEQKMLAESKGIFPERITNGECIFTDRRGDVWTATSWRYISRYMTNSSDAKQKSPIDNPDYIEVRAALIKYYDIVADRMLKYDRKNGGYYSISDIVLDSVACLTEIINSQNKT